MAGEARIFLIHATAVSMPPAHEAFARNWPEARALDLLDQSLSLDVARTGLTPSIHGRIAALARHAEAGGAQGVLFTCSAFGPAIDAARRGASIPMLKPDEAMLAQGAETGGKVCLLGTFQASMRTMAADFAAASRRLKAGAELQTLCVSPAREALDQGRLEEHDRLLAQAAEGLGDCAAIMLAHFSTARARRMVQAAAGRPVLTAPDSAVRALRAGLCPPPLD